MTIYAKQVPADVQTSPLEYCKERLPIIILDYNYFSGVLNKNNYDFESEYADLYKDIVYGMPKILDEYLLINSCVQSPTYEDFYEVCCDVISFDITEEMANKFKLFLDDNFYEYRTFVDYFILELFKIATDNPNWKITEIRDFFQGERKEVVYLPTEIDIDVFESEFFNAGTEWVIHDFPQIQVTSAEDIMGGSIYVTAYTEEDIKKEIRERCGFEDEEVVLFRFCEYHKTPVYELL